MPYKFETTKIKLPKAKDRRIKLSASDEKTIRRLYTRGYSIRKIAEVYKERCSRRLIQFVIFPERRELCRIQFKERRKDGRYYDKEKNTQAVRNHRRYKQSVLTQGGK